MNILVDCGVHDGENFSWFFNRNKNPSDCRIFGFEPNPEKEFTENNFIKVERKAVSNKNGTKKFYIMEKSVQSSLYRKKNGIVKKIVEVECIDLAEWFKKNMNKEDNIFLKLDVEGEEYKILPKLIKEGILEDYVNEMYVELHNKKLKK